MFDDPNFWDVLVWSFWFFIWICAVFIWFRCVFDALGTTPCPGGARRAGACF